MAIVSFGFTSKFFLVNSAPSLNVTFGKSGITGIYLIIWAVMLYETRQIDVGK
jgi:hypothetical protein